MSRKIFCCYAHEDMSLLNKLRTHLSPLLRERLIDVWFDGDIRAGTEWEQEIEDQLNTADIILILVSPDFMNSDYCYGKEMKRALERHERGEAQVIPIILRPVDWENAIFSKLQALPTGGEPITGRKWHNRDEAFLDVIKGIRTTVGKSHSITSKIPQKEQIIPVPKVKQIIPNGYSLKQLHDAPDSETSYLPTSIRSYGGNIFGYDAVAEISFGGESFPYSLVGDTGLLCLGQSITLEGDTHGYIPGHLTPGSTALVVGIRSSDDQTVDYLIEVIQENGGDAWIKPSNIEQMQVPLIIGNPVIRYSNERGHSVNALVLFSQASEEELHGHIIALQYQVAGEQRIIRLGDLMMTNNQVGRVINFSVKEKIGEYFVLMITIQLSVKMIDGVHYIHREFDYRDVMLEKLDMRRR